MLSKITSVGSSVGVIIPKYIASEGGFNKGAPVNIVYKDQQIIITKPKQSRQGWATAFAEYARQGEQPMLLPDAVDSESIDLL